MIDVHGYLGEPPPTVRQACAEAALVVGGARALAATGVPARCQVVLGRIDAAVTRVKEHLTQPGAGPVVVLASGDPLFYGVVRRLRADGLACRVHPGPSSVAAAFAAVGLPWDDAQLISAHGHGIEAAIAACRALPKVALLTAPGRGIVQVAAATADLDRWFVLAERLGEQDERLRVLDGAAARRLTPEEITDPNVLLVLAAPVDDRAALGKPGPLVGGPRPGMTTLPGAHPGAGPGESTAPETAPATAAATALLLGTYPPVLGQSVWTAGPCGAQVARFCARTGAAAIAVEVAADAGDLFAALPDPDLVVMDDLTRTAVLAGRRPRQIALIGRPDEIRAAAEELGRLGLPGTGRNVPTVVRSGPDDSAQDPTSLLVLGGDRDEDETA